MRRRDRRGEELATRANVVLIHNALASIRTIAYLRRDLGFDSGEVVDDYHELIRLLADTAASLPGSLRADSKGKRCEAGDAGDQEDLTGSRAPVLAVAEYLVSVLPFDQV
ncbi:MULTISPECIES: hypothetical protein [unclassified Kribbella]|uniref:hypothetical protein n=1 Tax=unclassified Kribbella TaxID=2644121 RepID=UPI003016550D